ncbi:hypothetical protein [Clostridium estertheticum]|uniref:Uncharacterized protein n=1 Tax=Clostridium estertheticum TaxID=238834 RepID=A0AA47EH12_9CLOT|nr:hypothetical protein [Clostridium estertheticum]MBU3155002.1 hypothetical protein [Clostridium estertheticum]WAG58821.1 hypothetical protein LL038_14280 [Clostridium estertheticum]
MEFKSIKELEGYIDSYTKSIEEFKKEIFEKININERNKTEIYAPQDLSIENEKEWLKKATIEIDEGKNKNVSIPKVTYIFLREDLFNKKKLLGSKIDNII